MSERRRAGGRPFDERVDCKDTVVSQELSSIMSVSTNILD